MGSTGNLNAVGRLLLVVFVCVSLPFVPSVNDAAFVESLGNLVDDRVTAAAAVWIQLCRVDTSCSTCCCSRPGRECTGEQEENHNEWGKGCGSDALTISVDFVLEHACVIGCRCCRHGSELLWMVFFCP